MHVLDTHCALCLCRLERSRGVVEAQQSKVKFPFSWRHLGERGLARYTLLWVRCSSPFLSLEPVGEASLKLWTRG